MADLYRVLFETVKKHRLKLYCNADPLMFRRATQAVPNSEIPDADWYPVTGHTTDSPWGQYDQLKVWELSNSEFVRKVRLERMARPAEWEEVDPDVNDHARVLLSYIKDTYGADALKEQP